MEAAYGHAYRTVESIRTGRTCHYTPPAHWGNSMWARVTEAVTELGADPWDYFMAAMQLRAGRLPLRPNQLATAECAAAWRQLVRQRVDHYRGMLRTQMEQLASGLARQRRLGFSGPEATLAALAAPLTGLSVLFRFCAGQSLLAEAPQLRPRLLPLLQAWRPTAAAQLSQGPDAYRAAWGAWVPPSLLTFARKLRGEVP